MDSASQTRLPGSTPDEMFPVLSAEQQGRVLAHGRRRNVRSGETLVELNQQPTKVFVVIEGKLEVLRVRDSAEEVLAICGPGMFTGELNLLSGRRALGIIRAAQPSELIEVEREALLSLVQTDSALSDIFLRAYILRRLELIARGVGDILLIGSSHSLDQWLNQNSAESFNLTNLTRHRMSRVVVDSKTANPSSIESNKARY